jgi:predicted amidohydrolase
MHGCPQVPVVASNRIGTEEFAKSNITFYGGSFISGNRGNVLKQVGAATDRGSWSTAATQLVKKRSRRLGGAGWHS